MFQHFVPETEKTGTLTAQAAVRPAAAMTEPAPRSAPDTQTQATPDNAAEHLQKIVAWVKELEERQVLPLVKKRWSDKTQVSFTMDNMLLHYCYMRPHMTVTFTYGTDHPESYAGPVRKAGIILERSAHEDYRLYGLTRHVAPECENLAPEDGNALARRFEKLQDFVDNLAVNGAYRHVRYGIDPQ